MGILIEQLPELLTPIQFAEFTGYNVQHVRRMCADGALHAVKVGRRWYVRKTMVFKDVL